MSNRTRFMSIAAAGFFIGVGAADAATLGIVWDDLQPSVQDAGQAPASAASGRELSAELDGRAVEITGFLLPSDREGPLIYEFLLVPWAGACSHMPSPPPNQVVRVLPDQPFEAEQTYQVVTVKGTLKPGLDKAQLFIFDGVKVVESGYSIGKAEVEAVAGAVGEQPTHGTSPWSFLDK